MDPVRIAVIGAGPAGFYACEELLKQEGFEVDLYDALPTPFGLVRAGVAPDHPKIKTVTRRYEKTAFRLFGPLAARSVSQNAHLRLASPRFAGVGYGGRVTVATASVTLESRFAWVLVDYRWINAERGLAEAGRATFICEQKPKGWRIVHVHSSQVLPWDR